LLFRTYYIPFLHFLFDFARGLKKFLTITDTGAQVETQLKMASKARRPNNDDCLITGSTAAENSPAVGNSPAAGNSPAVENKPGAERSQ